MKQIPSKFNPIYWNLQILKKKIAFNARNYWNNSLLPKCAGTLLMAQKIKSHSEGRF